MSDAVSACVPATATKAPTSKLGRLSQDIWSTEAMNDTSVRGRLKALLRVGATTVKGVIYNKIPVQSAALTYYTLMSIGPMLVLALTLGGFILSKQENGHQKLKAAISSAIYSMAPQTGIEVNTHTAAETSRSDPGAAAAVSPSGNAPLPAIGPGQTVELNLDGMVDNLLTQAASGGASAGGLLILIFLAVMMLSRVENAFNTIWNVAKGRPWKDRFVNYFLFMVVSCVLGAASLTMLSGASFAKQVAELPQWLRNLPGLVHFLSGAGPTLISIGLMALLVALFNKFMPNAKVRWIPALGGGLFVAVILVTNQKLGALYAGNVANFNKFYGSLSIILVLMFGMYLSWLFLLIGGQFTYALQNARTLAAYSTWEGLSARTKQTLCFGCLILIGRRFRNNSEAPDSQAMADMLHVPRSLTDQCLTRLTTLNLVVAIQDGDNNPDNDRFRPNFPLHTRTVADLKNHLESYNSNVAIDPKLHSDAGLARFDATYGQFNEIADARLSFESLLAETEPQTA
jgi:membrane protein